MSTDNAFILTYIWAGITIVMCILYVFVTYYYLKD